jgi:predicted nucleotidyltransferase
MSAAVKQLLAELRDGLKRIYGPRLRGLYLFGSYARNTPDPESDVDVLVVLDRIDRYGAEVDRTGDLASRLSLKYSVTVSRAFAAESDWREGDSPFLNNIRAEAVPA